MNKIIVKIILFFILPTISYGNYSNKSTDELLENLEDLKAELMQRRAKLNAKIKVIEGIFGMKGANPAESDEENAAGESTEDGVDNGDSTERSVDPEQYPEEAMNQDVAQSDGQYQDADQVDVNQYDYANNQQMFNNAQDQSINQFDSAMAQPNQQEVNNMMQPAVQQGVNQFDGQPGAMGQPNQQEVNNMMQPAVQQGVNQLDGQPGAMGQPNQQSVQQQPISYQQMMATIEKGAKLEDFSASQINTWILSISQKGKYKKKFLFWV